MTTLVCDDDRVWGRAMARTLDGQVVHAETIDTAVTWAEKLQPNVIILDTILPDGVGWEAIPRFRAASPTSQFLVVTAHSKLTDGIRALGEFGAAAYIEKGDGMAVIRREARLAFMASLAGSFLRWQPLARQPAQPRHRRLRQRHLA